ncbi:YpdA family putative bacillithiol disulfide reductase [Nafulsella turpanensis]|uniref:YpdA family putative bacillithiol disulfide reductase n=1 Tax=Nafulsella turpanensis TaxID=1265690 RepID=UPI00034777B7|nr:YpdA family putative bacillithiol disulfide reductase [Nafulsella turpanensis]
MHNYDLIIIGAGPCGLACGIEAAHYDLDYLIIEKGNITESIRRYPHDMKFFSTAENIEIGKLPLISQDIRPSRTEALKYYRRAANHYNLNIRPFTTVQEITKAGQGFQLKCEEAVFHARKVIIATGYYDIPKTIGVEGEDLPHVSHYYDEPYRYTNTRAVVVGGANSAIEVALDLYRNQVEVSLVHQFESLDKTAKYWIVPDLENRIKNGEVKAFFSSRVKRITKDFVEVEHIPTNRTKKLSADFVFLMTGYRPDVELLQKTGIQLNGPAYIPALNPQTYESNVAGIYMAGSVVGGEETAKIFIENGKLHAKPIIADIMNKRNRSNV